MSRMNGMTITTKSITNGIDVTKTPATENDTFFMITIIYFAFWF